MSRRPSRKLFLADLVLASLLSGLFVALFTSARAPTDATIVFFLIVVVVTTWSLFHQRRQSPTCEECGRWFIQPKRSILPIACPSCGREQPRRARMIRRTRTVFWSLLGLLVLIGVTTLTATAWLFRDPPRATSVDGLILIGLGGASQLTLIAAFGVGMYYSALARPKDRPCEACRSTIPVEVVSGPKMCPRCRLRHLRPVEARKEHAKGLGSLVILLLILSIPIVFSLWDPTGSKVAGHPFLEFARLILNLVALMIAAGVMWIALTFLLRMFRLRSERGAIAMARRYAGQDGEVIKDGPSTSWYSGPDDPVPMLREQMEAARRRFGELTGEAVPEPAHRILVFHDRAAFLRFHARIAPGIDLTSFDGLYLGHARGLSTLCTSPAPCRVTQPERTIRSLVAYALLESLWGPRPPAWLQSGLARSVAVVDCDALARLNRKMLASLSLGTALSVEMFGMTLNGLTRLLRGSKEPQKYEVPAVPSPGLVNRRIPPRGFLAWDTTRRHGRIPDEQAIQDGPGRILSGPLRRQIRGLAR